MIRPVQLQLAGPPLKKSQKQLLPATQTSSLEESSTEIVRSNISSFSIIFSLSVNFSFPTNYFSTPPGVWQNKKSPSHFTMALTTAKTEYRKPTAFAAPAESSPRHGQGCEPDPP